MPLPPLVDDLWADLRAGLSLFTRLPLGQRTEVAPGQLARATRLSPVAGLAVGLVGAGLFWLAAQLGLPPLVAGLCAVGGTVLFTGALHEDGLADVADGFGGAFERTRKLEIMRDSRIGTYGALALVFSVAGRAAALSALAAPSAVAGALIAAHAVSRAFLPAVMAGLPLARSTGLAAKVERPTLHHAGVALLLAAVLAVLALGPAQGLAGLIAGGAAAAAVAWLAQSQIGGYSGDVLGAAQQAAELAVLLTLVALA